jgi:LysR family transcriptional activator of nhaA
MLRLVARDSDWLTVLPAVVVQDELESGVLMQVGQSALLRERFYAITTQQHHRLAVLDRMIENPAAANTKAGPAASS